MHGIINLIRVLGTDEQFDEPARAHQLDHVVIVIHLWDKIMFNYKRVQEAERRAKAAEKRVAAAEARLAESEAERAALEAKLAALEAEKQGDTTSEA